ncbi:MAG: hypothetical protein HS122_13585 [Opitutaceae bacterium]|nr:hypothetical protein [Opitutaceae bacterium]
MSLALLSSMLVVSGLWSALLVRRIVRLGGTVQWLAVSGAAWLAALCWVPFLSARAVGMESSIYLSIAIFIALFLLEFFLDRRGPIDAWIALCTSLRRWCARGNRGVFAGAFVLLLFHAAGHYWHCLREADGSYWSAGAGWEDQSFHTALATSFSSGDNLSRLSYPHVPNWPLGYPFLPDFQAGWLHAQGFSLPVAFRLGNILASAVFLLAAWSLLKRWLESRARAFLALAVWHLAAGWGFLYLLHEWKDSGSLVSALWAHDYANDWALELHFHNLVTAIVWPMRVALFGLALSCAIAVLIRALLSARDTSIRGFVFAGALAGTLPLIGAHGLVVLACVVTPWALLNRPLERLKTWIAAVIAGAVFAVPQILWMRHQLSQSEPAFVRFAPGWMIGDWRPNALWQLLEHWVWNTGLWVTLGFLAWCLAGRRFRRETIGWWLILSVGYLFVFQPYVFDNIKLFAAAGLAAAAGCAWMLAELWRHRIGGRLASVILFGLMTISGVQSIVSEARAPAVVSNADERRFAEAVTAATPRDALILTGTQLNHPVLVLAGRRVVAANPSGMTLHGMPHAFDRAADVEKIYSGSPDAGALLAHYRPGWLVIGPMERTEFEHIDIAYLDRISEHVLTEGAWELRRLKPNGLQQ